MNTQEASPGEAFCELARDLIIVGCSAEKTPTDTPLPALDLYDGGCVPMLRGRVGQRADHRARIRFLSAQHGYITADTALSTYDRALDPARARDLRRLVDQQVRFDLAAHGIPGRILLIAEPLYLVLIADLFAMPDRPLVHWIPDHARGWPEAAAILDEWCW